MFPIRVFGLMGATSSGGTNGLPSTGFLTQEDGAYLLQEDGNKIIFTAFFALAQEDGFLLLQENGNQIYA